MAKTKRTNAGYEQVFSDLVNTYSLNIDEAFDSQSFENQMKLIDARSRFKPGFVSSMFETDRAQQLIKENIDREEQRIRNTFFQAETEEELVALQQQELSQIKSETLKDRIEREARARKSTIARRQSQERKVEVRKQSLFVDPERVIALGNYRSWSSVQNFYKLTDEELVQLEQQYPELGLS